MTASRHLAQGMKERDTVREVHVNESWMFWGAVLLGLLLLLVGWKLASILVPGFGVRYLVTIGLTQKIVAVVLSVLVHEAVHVAALLTLGRCSWSEVSFGIQWRTFTPYVQCLRPLSTHRFQACVLAPFLATGLLPFVLGVLAEQSLVVVWAIIMSSAASGDLIIAARTLGLTNNAMLQDDPHTIGFTARIPSD